MCNPKLPKYIYISSDKVRLSYDKKLPYLGFYNCDKCVIQISPTTADIGTVLLHEICEYISASMHAVYFREGKRYIEFTHSPDNHVDNWSTFIEILNDTIRRNNLSSIIFRKKK